MIKVIKYVEPYNDTKSHDLTVTIKDGIISVTSILSSDTSEPITTTLEDIPILPYNRYVIYENNSNLGIINTTEYTSFKKSKLSYLTRLTGMIELYTIAVCDITDTNKNIIFNPGTKKVKNITVVSDVEVQEQNISSIEERDIYFWKYLNNIRKCYSFTINDIIYYGNIISDNTNDVYSLTTSLNTQNIDEIIDLTENTKEYIEINIQKYSYNNKEELSNLDTDNDEIEITTTGGVLNTSIINLKNGKGNVRLYPMGYKGEFTISIGMIFNGSDYKLKL